MNYNNVVQPNPLQLPEEFIAPLKFEKIVDGYPVYTAEVPSKKLLGKFATLLCSRGYPQSTIDMFVSMLENVAAAACMLEVDGVEMPVIVTTVYCLRDRKLIEHELVHCRQMEIGQLITDNESGIVTWEGKEFTLEDRAAIQSWGEKKGHDHGLRPDESVHVAQMILPWERVPYEITRHRHPELSALADELYPQCPYL